MLLQDIRYALRALVHHPVFTLVAVACLAIGIGVNATIFAIVDGVLIQPFPYADPGRLVVLNETHQRSGIRRAPLSYANLREWQGQQRIFSAMAAAQGRSLTISDRENEPERYLGAAISWNLFAMLGTPPALGRAFTPEDDRPGAEPVVLLGDQVWRRRFHADPSIVGRRILVNAAPRTVIGVMPSSFEFPVRQKLWVPLAPFAHAAPRDQRDLQVYARLKPGATLEQARSEAAAIASRLAAAYKEHDGWGATVRPLADAFIPDDVRLVILAMMGAVTLVLLIACANVANLLLARAAARAKEISIRAALGAGRGRIVRQLLSESAVLGLLAAPPGIALALVGVKLIDSAIPPDDIPYYIHWAVDGRTLLYSVVVAVAAGLVFGLAPAAHAVRGNLHESLKEGRGGGSGGRRARLRNAFVIAEVALSLVLLVGAALFVRSFVNLKQKSAGFDTAPLMTLRIYLTGDAYETDDAKIRRVADIVQRVEALPGVTAAFASNLVPLGGGGGGGRIAVEGRVFPAGEEPRAGFVGVTPHLYRTLGIPIQRGRDLTDAEGLTKEPVAVINRTMADRFWPELDPIGRRFRIRGEGADDQWFTVIGIAGDFYHGDLDDDEPPLPSAYVPYGWMPTPNTGLTIRAAGDPVRITSAVREEIRRADPDIPLFQVRAMEEVRQLGFWQYGLFGWMFSVFGGVALFLAAIGVYGVLSYAVSQRTQEIGVRLALGANRRDVLRLVVLQGVRLAAVGVAIGVVGAFGVTRLIRSLLVSVTPTEPATFIGVSLFLLIVAVLASYFPARRATAVDPIAALRME